MSRSLLLNSLFMKYLILNLFTRNHGRVKIITRESRTWESRRISWKLFNLLNIINMREIFMSINFSSNGTRSLRPTRFWTFHYWSIHWPWMFRWRRKLHNRVIDSKTSWYSLRLCTLWESLSTPAPRLMKAVWERSLTLISAIEWIGHRTSLLSWRLKFADRMMALWRCPSSWSVCWVTNRLGW